MATSIESRIGVVLWERFPDLGGNPPSPGGRELEGGGRGGRTSLGGGYVGVAFMRPELCGFDKSSPHNDRWFHLFVDANIHKEREVNLSLTADN